MDATAYFERLKDRYRGRFDVYESGHPLLDNGFDLLASYRMRGERYLLKKSVTLYGVEEYEHCLVRVLSGEATHDELASMTERLVQSIPHLVKPHPEHMRTCLTGVAIAETGSTPSALTYARRFRYNKSFRFGLHGWCHIRLVLVDLFNNVVAHHPWEKQLKTYYCFI